MTYGGSGFLVQGPASGDNSCSETLFVLQLAVNAGTVAMIVAGNLSAGIVAEASGQRGGMTGFLPVSDWLLLGSTLIPSVFVVIAVFALRHSRMRALRLFHRAVLLSILFTEVFMFYRNQAAALVVLALNFYWITHQQFQPCIGELKACFRPRCVYLDIDMALNGGVLAFNLFSWACINVVLTRESRVGARTSV